MECIFLCIHNLQRMIFVVIIWVYRLLDIYTTVMIYPYLKWQWIFSFLHRCLSFLYHWSDWIDYYIMCNTFGVLSEKGTLFVCLLAISDVPNVSSVSRLSMCLMCPMFPVSLDCPFLIAFLVFIYHFKSESL
jgi:hypothetical protein